MPDFDTFMSRVKYFMEPGENLKAFSKRTKVPYENIKKWKQREDSNPDRKGLIAFAEFFNLDAAGIVWLHLGIGDPPLLPGVYARKGASGGSSMDP